MPLMTHWLTILRWMDLIWRVGCVIFCADSAVTGECDEVLAPADNKATGTSPYFRWRQRDWTIRVSALGEFDETAFNFWMLQNRTIVFVGGSLINPDASQQWPLCVG